MKKELDEKVKKIETEMEEEGEIKEDTENNYIIKEI